MTKKVSLPTKSALRTRALPDWGCHVTRGKLLIYLFSLVIQVDEHWNSTSSSGSLPECTSPGCPKTQNSSPKSLHMQWATAQLQVFVLQYVIHIKSHININTFSALSIHPRMKTWSIACTCLSTYMLTFFLKKGILYLEILFHILQSVF